MKVRERAAGVCLLRYFFSRVVTFFYFPFSFFNAIGKYVDYFYFFFKFKKYTAGNFSC